MNQPRTLVPQIDLEAQIDLGQSGCVSSELRASGDWTEAPRELVLGRIVGGRDRAAVVLFEVDGRNYCSEAMVTCDLSLPRDVGREVCLSFVNRCLTQPVVLGLVHRSEGEKKELAITSEMGISLSCGKAKILLRPDGTIAIRGVNIASRASHTNRIRGGNVQIN